MRLLTNFQDYYDNCTYTCGEDVVYQRTLGNYSKNNDNRFMRRVVPSEILDRISNLYNEYYGRNRYINKSLVIIGEKVIPFIQFQKEYNSPIITIINEKNLESIKSESIYYFNMKTLYEHFSKNHIDFYRRLRDITSEPIVSIGISFKYDVETSYFMQNGYITLNPKLKDIEGFSKSVPSSEVIQELEMYINKLNNKETEVRFSNENRIQQAGFDSNSFRGK